MRNFYPRSPRGERPVPRRGADLRGAISIHAPREGSDRPVDGQTAGRTHFYPRSPRGERLTRGARLLLVFIFLSTLPARGATILGLQGPDSGTISIHAPREGSDPLGHHVLPVVLAISIHAPREGSDGRVFRPGRPHRGISIHAPREGSDGPSPRPTTAS